MTKGTNKIFSYKFFPVGLTLSFIMIIMVLVSINFNWGKKSWNGIIENDAKGYYAYLPAVVIYQDLNFHFFDSIDKKKYYDPNLYYDYRSSYEGKTINKYYCGTAIAEAPFFLIAHLISYVKEGEMDGYARIYPVFISIGALFYLLLGLIFLSKTLRLYSIRERTISFILMVAVFGTNLFYYVESEPGMSHVYSFAFISMFVYFIRSFMIDPAKRKLFIIGFILGMIMLIRPVNGLVIFFIPFLAGSKDQLIAFFKKLVEWKFALLISAFIFALVLSIQFIIYKISTGSFFVYSYGEEGFNFLNPKFLQILFSYKKGLFLYTPVYLISFLGLIFLWHRARYEFFTWLGFFLLITYVFSSWWMWYYGGSFSSRVYVEFIPVFMIVLAIGLHSIKEKWLRFSVNVVLVALVLICQIQIVQYRYYQIHWADMTKERYWDVFLRIDKIHDKKYGL